MALFAVFFGALFAIAIYGALTRPDITEEERREEGEAYAGYVRACASLPK